MIGLIIAKADLGILFILFCPSAMRDLSIPHRDHPEVLSLLRIVSALLSPAKALTSKN